MCFGVGRRNWFSCLSRTREEVEIESPTPPKKVVRFQVPPKVVLPDLPQDVLNATISSSSSSEAPLSTGLLRKSPFQLDVGDFSFSFEDIKPS